MDSVIRDIQVPALSKYFGIQTSAGTQEFVDGIHRWPKTTTAFQRRTAHFSQLRRTLQTRADLLSFTRSDEPEVQTRGGLLSFTRSDEPEVQTRGGLLSFTRMKEAEEILEPLLRKATAVEDEGYGQLYFRGTPWSFFNTIPLFLIALSLYKTFLVPFLTILMPLLSMLLPYCMLYGMTGMRMPFDEYIGVLWKLWNGNLFQFNPQTDTVDQLGQQLKLLIQYVGTIATVFQSVWHPVQQALHFHRLDTGCLKLSAVIQEVREWTLSMVSDPDLAPWFPSWTKQWTLECPSDQRESFAFVLEHPYWLPHLFRAIGRFEVLVSVATHAHTQPVYVVPASEASAPVLELKGMSDPFLDADKAVASSFSAGGSQPFHTMLTGPNRGGKSSALRAILTNVVLAHAYGCVLATSGRMTRTAWIGNGLRLEDTPGKVSMFEREVAFARSVFSPHAGFGLVLYDECFHSTNPPDAIRTANLFCSRLWKDSRCISVLSTHIYSLAASAPTDRVQRLCVPAYRDAKRRFHFSYRLTPGICTLSSVDCLLEGYGLLSSAPVSAAPVPVSAPVSSSVPAAEDDNGNSSPTPE